MKINVEDIKKVTPSRPLVVQLPNRLECNSTRNLVSYVNNTYPVGGYRYRVHITKDYTVVVTLVENNK